LVQGRLQALPRAPARWPQAPAAMSAALQPAEGGPEAERETPQKRKLAEVEGAGAADETPEKVQKCEESFVGSRARVKGNANNGAGRVGEVLVHDPQDQELPFKIRFSDGADDWLKASDIEIQPSFKRAEQMRRETEEELEALKKTMREDFEEYKERLTAFAAVHTAAGCASLLLGFVPGAHLATAAKDAAIVNELQSTLKEAGEIGATLMHLLDTHAAGTSTHEEEVKLMQILTRKTKVIGEDLVKQTVGKDKMKYQKEGEPGVRVLKSFVRVKSLRERLQTLDALFHAGGANE